MLPKTQIIATVGPASRDYETLKSLVTEGVNIFRLNFSHGTHEWYRELFADLKRLDQELGCHVPIMLDTKGPEIRTGDVKKPIVLQAGDHLTLTVEPGAYEQDGRLRVNYEQFASDVEVGDVILLDNGIINLKVLDKNQSDVVCEVLEEGEITARRHLNLPMKETLLEPITEQDWQDIEFGLEQGIDLIALSFVRDGSEVAELQRYLQNHNHLVEVVAKVESYEATKNLDCIVQTADRVMVARGDLGAEVRFSQVPVLQQQILDLGKRYQTPVIVATQMLESMVEHPIPTRAEVTDVFVAVKWGADAIMLSGETANGKYPVKAVQTMREISDVAESI